MKRAPRALRLLLAAIACVAVGVGIGLLAHAVPNVPQGIAYSGILRDGNGNLVGANTDFVFDLFDGNGPVGCSDARNAVALKNGRFDIPDLFGKNCPLDSLLAKNQGLQVRITVGQSILSPNQPLGTVPFAARARVAETVEARPVYTNSQTGKKYSLDAGYCGATPQTNGKVGGYLAAKALCETACGNSPTAHLCGAEEMFRFSSTGGTVPQVGWIGSGVEIYTIANGLRSDDCESFITNSASFLGQVWSPGNSPIGASGCDVSWPMLCCD